METSLRMNVLLRGFHHPLSEGPAHTPATKWQIPSEAHVAEPKGPR